MERHKLIFLSNTLDEVEAELEALMIVQEWYVTAVVDKIKASREILNSELNNNNEDSILGHRDRPTSCDGLGPLGPEHSNQSD